MFDKSKAEFRGWRGVSSRVMEKYGAMTHIENGKPVEIAFPYSEGQGWKIRSLTEKSFTSVGSMSEASLFGMSAFAGGSSRYITITEGEMDAMAAHQMTGMPAVSVRGASSAKTDSIKAFSYLDSFEKIYLCFDNDAAGEKALASVAPLFDFNKIYHVRMSKYKDALEFLENGEAEEFKRIWWNSKRFLPEGIKSRMSEFSDILDGASSKPSHAFPFKTLNAMTTGIQTGEIYLFTALEGVGKTEIIRAIEYDILETTDDNIGVLHLEEDKARTLQGYANYVLKQPVHKPDAGVSKDDIKKALGSCIKRDDRLHLYTHFGSDDPEVILGMIRFIVAVCGCKYVFLDHITMVVTGLGGEDDERKALDHISTRLAMMVKELDFALILVSHVNDEGKTRGSRLISKVASTWVHLDRDLEAGDEVSRNTTRLMVKKNRPAALTGPAGAVYFDPETYILADYDETRHVDLLPVE